MDTIYWWMIIIVVVIGVYTFITRKSIKMGTGRDDDDEDKKEAERIKAIFTSGKYKEGGKYVYMGGPTVRIKYLNYWPHCYEVKIEWLDKNYSYNEATIFGNIEENLIPA